MVSAACEPPSQAERLEPKTGAASHIYAGARLLTLVIADLLRESFLLWGRREPQPGAINESLGKTPNRE